MSPGIKALLTILVEKLNTAEKKDENIRNTIFTAMVIGATICLRLQLKLDEANELTDAYQEHKDYIIEHGKLPAGA